MNNAGYGQFGFVEELSEQEARDQIETNVFGALWITQAALPYLREQRSGHIIQVSSSAASPRSRTSASTTPQVGAGGLLQSLAQEVAPFGVRVTLVEPIGYSTDWGGSSAKHAKRLAGYAEVHAATDAERGRRWSKPGDPNASAAALLKVVDAQEPPLRVFFGGSALATAKADYESRLVPGNSGSRSRSWRRA